MEGKRSKLYQSKLRLFEGEWVMRVGGGKVLTRNNLRNFRLDGMKSGVAFDIEVEACLR